MIQDRLTPGCGLIGFRLAVGGTLTTTFAKVEDGRLIGNLASCPSYESAATVLRHRDAPGQSFHASAGASMSNTILAALEMQHFYE
jgi:hypothetical protein